MKVKFIIHGKPVGYTATTKRGKWTPEFQKFAKYAKRVRKCAKEAGVKLPLEATRLNQLVIRTISYFHNGVHPDPGNVQKGIVDALFYDEDGVKTVKRTNKKKAPKRKRTKKGDDKHCGGSFPPPRYDKENPRVVIIIKNYKEKKK